MCDETTDRELDDYLKRKAMTRRDFTARATATFAASGLLATACATPPPAAGKLSERNVLVPMPDGKTADALFVHPTEGKHAAIIIWPDVHGVRPAFFDMARKLASSGYSVIAVNPYYRTLKGRLFQDGEYIDDPGGRDRIMPHISVFSVEGVTADSIALANWLDQQEGVVDTSRGVGAVGFCMTGSWTLAAAAAAPERIRAAASFHGGRLVTDDAQSPHLLAEKIRGGVLIAIAENDHARAPEVRDTLVSAFETYEATAEIEVYEDAMHGWVTTDSPAHDPEHAERAWNRMLALFDQHLS
ncbi:MAG: dienelactone hydrolase family protein [Henriciella sp.]